LPPTGACFPHPKVMEYSPRVAHSRTPPSWGGSYRPILRGEHAELAALGWLDDAVKTHVVPLVELSPTELDDAATRIRDGWGAERPILLDAVGLDPRARVAGDHPIVDLFESCRGRVKAIPVGGLGRGIDHAAAIAGVAAAQGRGAALRLDAADLAAASGQGRLTEEWLAVVDLTPEEVDLVIDLGEVSEPGHMGSLLAAHEALASLPYAIEWRSVTLAGTAIPSLPRNGKSDSEELCTRLDWRLWKMVACDDVPRAPDYFGDRVFAPADSPGGMTITYTTGCSWLVVKRRRVAPRVDELRAASQLVSTRPEFAGPEHCRGCAFIVACASGATSGTPASWRSVIACHHIHASVEELAQAGI